jgi:autotransporter strand-loop-strand O-heptosyltransferase
MEIKYSFNNGPRIDIIDGDLDLYSTQLFEYVNGLLYAVTSFEQGNNTFVKHMRQWYTDWEIRVYGWTEQNGLELKGRHRFNLTDKNVKINIDSDNIVDAKIWLNYVIEFKNKYNCVVYINSKFNDRLFKFVKNTSDIHKYDPSQIIDFYATYDIGRYDLKKYGVDIWGNFEHYNGNIKEGHRVYKSFKNPSDWSNLPTGQIATDILGLKYNPNYENLELSNFRDSMMNEYNNVETKSVDMSINNTLPKMSNSVSINFIDGPFVEIKGDVNESYYVEFIDSDTNEILHASNITNNMWTKASIKYHLNWLINIYSNNKLIFTHKFNPEGKNVYIALDSSSLGDTLAWFPYVEEYAKKHNCKVICSTFWNNLFEETYPDIVFVKPGNTVYDIYAQFNIGIFGDGDRKTDKNPRDTRNIPLQQVATDILGLEFKEVKPRIHVPKLSKIRSGLIPNSKYVAIAQHGTSQCKYWNNEYGWSETVDYLKSKGYQVMSVSKEGTKLKGVLNRGGNNKDIIDTIYQISNADFFIGISSGLSWLAWALNIPTILISGHTQPYYEFKNPYRVHRGDVCNGCWHNHNFDKGNWNWCPVKQGTNQMFECTKSIKFTDVKFMIDVISDDKTCYFETNDSEKIVSRNLKKENLDFKWDNLNLYDDSNIIIYEVYRDRLYENDGCKIEFGDIVMDFGANIGIFSRYACEQGASKVYSFEPDSLNFECLTKNSKDYPIECFNKAVFDKEGIIKFNKKNASGIHAVAELDTEQIDAERKDTVDVEATTFQKIVSELGIDRINYLKIDVEGSEKNIIYSMKQEHFDIIDKISLEYHHRAFNHNEQEKDKFVNYIVNMGFKNYFLFYLRDNHEIMMRFWK